MVRRVEVAKTRDATFAEGLQGSQCVANIKPPKVSPIRNRKFDDMLNKASIILNIFTTSSNMYYFMFLSPGVLRSLLQHINDSIIRWMFREVAEPQICCALASEDTWYPRELHLLLALSLNMDR